MKDTERPLDFCNRKMMQMIRSAASQHAHPKGWPTVIWTPLRTLYGAVMKPDMEVAGADLRRAVVIKNEDSCAFCLRLWLTFLHQKVPLRSARRLSCQPPSVTHCIITVNRKQTHSWEETKDDVVGVGCAGVSIPALESAISTPGAFDLTSCFKQLASPQPLSTSHKYGSISKCHL